MRLDAIQPRRALAAEMIVPQWRLPLIRLALAWAVLFALFASDYAEMVMQWWDSSTYNHILLVPAILVWLVWQRAGELAKLAPASWWPGLVPLAGALFVWLLGDISGTATASHLGLVLALQSLVLTMLGPRVSWALFFPLAYGLFLVPIGDELVPALQMITADITIALTMASGIPAHIEGVFIDTPAGLFEVAEACSGVKFLIAMIALGTLVSHVLFQSWWRRIGFMALAIALPILANGVRAWGTIYIAQSQGIAFAAGFDHIFYGWFFFALVMGLLLAIGWKFFDRTVDDAFIDADNIAALPFFSPLERWNGKGWAVFAASIAITLAALVWAAQSRALEAEIADTLALPEVPGWTQVAEANSYPWAPLAGGADRVLRGSYRDADGRTVDVVFALYAAQGDGREAGAFGQGALPPDTDWRWQSATLSADGVPGQRIQAMATQRRTAETWFRKGDWTGTSGFQLKLRTMQDRLFLTARPTAMLILSAEEDHGVDGVQAVADFRASTSDLGEWIDRAGSIE
ncbi:exosortase A [Erythrobacter sp. EC-HK427]|uniref:exosortase A n=1 Tax=Erythrobacter sp. EC-HK427 TaxID=2038396 RepID=UPI0012598606|nr:exosortase A [Erythrobacter sp. EC-HK427]VVT16162.1 ABC transporter [Erythrobacter sp. EC-HK427]